MDHDDTWYGGRPQPRPHCARWGLSSPLQKGGRAPNFRPMSIVPKRLDGSRCHLVVVRCIVIPVLIYFLFQFIFYSLFFYFYSIPVFIYFSVRVSILFQLAHFSAAFLYQSFFSILFPYQIYMRKLTSMILFSHCTATVSLRAECYDGRLGVALPSRCLRASVYRR